MLRWVRNKATALMLSVALLFSCFYTPTPADTVYHDGTYVGSGIGYTGHEDATVDGTITATVTIEDGIITSVALEGKEQTTQYGAYGWPTTSQTMIERILDAQSAEVDAVTSATYSSKGIKEAVGDALSQAVDFASTGSGTMNDPYTIRTVTQLEEFRAAVDGGTTYAGQYVVLAKDLTLEDEWDPIGTNTAGFAGTFDGDDHRIQDVAIDMEASGDTNAGFFSILANTATIKNLHLESVSMSVYSNGGVVRLGGIAGDCAGGTADNRTVIDNCSVAGDIISAETSGASLSFAGGILGRTMTYASVTNCWSDVDISATSGGNPSAYAGGLTGMSGNNTLICNSYTLGDIAASSPNSTNFAGMAGGIAAMLGGKQYNCYAMGDTAINNTSSTQRYIGALDGQITGSGGNGFAQYGYYNTRSSQTVNGAERDEVAPVGPTVSDAVYSDLEGYTESFMESEDFADVLNENLPEINRSILPAGIYLNKWVYDADSDVVCLTAAPSANPTIFASGTGSQADPFIIETPEQMENFANSLNADLDYENYHIKLANDIDLTELDGDWTPIGASSYTFEGTFDGDGNEIQHLTIGSESNPSSDPSAYYAGVFSVLGPNAVVKDLGVTDAQVYLRFTGSSASAAALAGYSQGALIDNCYATGVLRAEAATVGNCWAGGLVASSYQGSIVNSWTDTAVSARAAENYWAEAGGLIGLSNRTTIANCYSLGDTGAASAGDNLTCVGGMAGMNAGYIVNSYATGGQSTAAKATDIGVITGRNTGIGEIYNSYYNEEAVQIVQGAQISPAKGVAVEVDGGIIKDVAGKTPSEMQEEEFAALLNSNYDLFPVELSSGVALRQWELQGGMVTPTGAVADIQPAVEIPRVYEDGTYTGRARNENGAYIYVSITTYKESPYAGDEIKSIEVTSHSEEDGFTEIAGKIIDAVMATQSTDIDVEVEDGFSNAAATLLGAIDIALYKAQYGDTRIYRTAFAPDFFTSGTGTEQDPYIIKTKEELKAFGAYVSGDETYEGEDFAGRYVKLAGNISLAGENWSPMGGDDYAFCGSFDGDGYAISNLTIGNPTAYAHGAYIGLFGILDTNAEISNLTLTDVSIYAENSASTIAGTLAGYAAGAVIDNCAVTGEVYSKTTEEGNNFAGGLIGQTYRGYIANCRIDVKVSSLNESEYWSEAGGMMGSNNRTAVINCYVLGDVSGSSNKVNRTAVGGLAGMQAGVVINSYAMGDVTSVAYPATDLGVFAGRNTGIAMVSHVYYNKDAIIASAGETIPTTGVGVQVDGQVTDNLVEMTAGDMKNKSFAELLNSNIDNGTVAAALQQFTTTLPESIDLYKWAYDTEKNLVSLNTADNVTITVQAEGNGTAAGSGAYRKNSQVTVVATANSGYKFSGWYVGETLVSSNATYTFTASGDTTLIAKFTKKSGSSSGGGSPSSSSSTTPTTPAPTDEAPKPAETSSISKIYNDIPVSYEWAVSYIEKLSEMGILSGRGDGGFDPAGKVTRAEFMKIIVLALEIEAGDSAALFSDVDSTAWYAEFMNTAASAGIISGYEDGSAKPNHNITREEIAVMLVRAVGEDKMAELAGKEAVGFADAGSFSDWAASSIELLARAGIINGDAAQNFNPQKPATRAETAKMVCALLELLRK
ncbi:S-layer homology domain-containing protein [Candidatus Formimonas warabiya]|uniref:SLH domain-containing protein n=1 Tax=Formimonas warabiya TaxID=1761012 RepID=A0A3G1KYI4_FORW1|nr:S-layer homology domain-containing protein [Candidatus Formimonas warabiya]ATW27275.1 hypothetical protein DCMF_23220 [Candidatus Formimonas warabiya]